MSCAAGGGDDAVADRRADRRQPQGELRRVERRSGRDRRQGAERTLVVIGGSEEREGAMPILAEVARRVGGRRLVVTTVASREPEGYFEIYRRAFRDLGLDDVVELRVRERSEAADEARLALLEEAGGVFFTGGDQLRITSQIGDTRVSHRIAELYRAGAVVAGTSAGAAAMCEIMLVEGPGRASHKIGSSLRMAPGLGFLPGVVVDQHFAQRARMGRLLGAIAQNPRELGVGIDENTAIVVESEASFSVLGSGAVYVIDGAGLSHSNIAEGRDEATLSMYDVRLHLLAEGDAFDLVTRRPGTKEGRPGAEAETEAETEAAAPAPGRNGG